MLNHLAGQAVRLLNMLGFFYAHIETAVAFT
nr:MAG TPA: hypothetical protein [Caudoviricetes sp.]DAT13312.1 MAG TPA: hypothetical protein [Caudoviricetes sp.]